MSVEFYVSGLDSHTGWTGKLNELFASGTGWDLGLSDEIEDGSYFYLAVRGTRGVIIDPNDDRGVLVYLGLLANPTDWALAFRILWFMMEGGATVTTEEGRVLDYADLDGGICDAMAREMFQAEVSAIRQQMPESLIIPYPRFQVPVDLHTLPATDDAESLGQFEALLANKVERFGTAYPANIMALDIGGQPLNMSVYSRIETILPAEPEINCVQVSGMEHPVLVSDFVRIMGGLAEPAGNCIYVHPLEGENEQVVLPQLEQVSRSPEEIAALVNGGAQTPTPPPPPPGDAPPVASPAGGPVLLTPGAAPPASAGPKFITPGAPGSPPVAPPAAVPAGGSQHDVLKAAAKRLANAMINGSDPMAATFELIGEGGDPLATMEVTKALMATMEAFDTRPELESDPQALLQYLVNEQGIALEHAQPTVESLFEEEG